MKKIIFSLLVITIFSFQASAQVAGAAGNLKDQVEKMGAAFGKGDYKTFSIYTYPLLVRSMGGPVKMAAALSKITNDMKAQGMSFGEITFDEPPGIVKSGKEFQATIAQHTEIVLSGGRGRLISTSTLIGLSEDNGLTWTFIDTSNKEMATIKKMLPDLSAAIVIPAQQKPVHFNE